MSLLTLLDHALNAPLPAADGARRHVGYLGWDVPVELILAAGATPVHLGDMTSDSTELADRFLENSFSAASRAVAQRWLSGDLDELDAVIFSRSDDSAQRLYYYVCELQRMGECKGPTPLLYDLARIGRASSLAHTVESTRSLAAALSADEQRLNDAIQRVAARSLLLTRLGELRASDAVPQGTVAHRIIRAARTDWSEPFEAALREWLQRPEISQPRKRVLLVGSVPMNECLHEMVEIDGVCVVGEINESHAGPEQLSGDATSPILAIAHRCHRLTSTATALLQSPEGILKIARALRADAVIVWMLATDTGIAWEAPKIVRTLRDGKMPTLVLTSQPRIIGADTLAQIEQFRRALEHS